MGTILLVLMMLLSTVMVMSATSASSHEPMVIYVDRPRKRRNGCIGPTFLLLILMVFAGLMIG